MTRRQHIALLCLGVACVLAPAASGFAQGGAVPGKGQTGAAKGKGATPRAEAGAAAAEEGPVDEARVLYSATPDDPSLFQFDYGPPTSPASQLLGIDSGASPPSTSLTSFVLSIPNVLGQEQGQSIALDFAPAALFEHREAALFRRYVARPNYFYRLGYRSRLTAAALNGRDGGADPSKAIRSGLAFGFSASLLDSSDPMVTGRDTSGLTVLQRCLTPLIAESTTILQQTRAPTEADTTSEFAREAFSLARTEARAGNFAAARDRIRPFVEPQRAPAEPAPGQPPAAGAAPAAGAPAAGAPAAGPASPADAHQQRLAQARAMLASMESNPSISEEQKQFMRLMLAEVEQLGTERAGREGAPQREAGARPDGAGSRAGPQSAANAQPQAPSRPVADIPDDQLVEFIEQRLASLGAEGVQLNAASSRAIATRFADAGLTARISLCSELASRTARFSPDFDIGGGLVARGRPGELADLELEGGAVWAAVRYPIFTMFPAENDRRADHSMPTSALMFAASGRYGWNERLATGDKTTPEFQANTLGAWVGLEYLSPNYRLAGQYGWRRTYARSPLGEPFEVSGDRFLLQGQVQLGNERSPLWLDVSYGQATGTTDALDDETVMITLRYTPPKPPNISR
jgi:hypothetical protein